MKSQLKTLNLAVHQQKRVNRFLKNGFHIIKVVSQEDGMETTIL